MTDRPILFSEPMVRALLENRKSQTRRVLKPQPDTARISAPFHPEPRAGRTWVFMARDDFPGYSYATANFTVPYAVGDRLWVRERWGTIKAYDNRAPRQLHPGESTIGYATDDIGRWCQTGCNGAAGKWRPSIHMPRWASRLTLTVTDVRVQRVQEITEEDAVAEGVPPTEIGTCPYVPTSGEHTRAVIRFRTLWDSLNAKRAPWSENPWVAALTFSVETRNIDQ